MARGDPRDNPGDRRSLAPLSVAQPGRRGAGLGNRPAQPGDCGRDRPVRGGGAAAWHGEFPGRVPERARRHATVSAGYQRRAARRAAPIRSRPRRRTMGAHRSSNAARTRRDALRQRAPPRAASSASWWGTPRRAPPPRWTTGTSRYQEVPFGLWRTIGGGVTLQVVFYVSSPWRIASSRLVSPIVDAAGDGGGRLAQVCEGIGACRSRADQ
jgi:hypothetical protein